MWTYQGKSIREGKAWTNADGIQHPPNWGGAWSTSEKTAAGLLWQDDPVSFDNRFWSNPTTPKPLDDSNALDEDGNAIIEDGQQVVVLGLKSTWKAIIKSKANGLLSSTDWYVTRKAETDTAVPSTITQYRNAVRAASATIEASIDGAADHAAFVALFDTPEDGVAPIANWPDEV